MRVVATKHAYKGLLAIGDPHLEGRVPGFRKDDYPQVVIEKLRWALDYAAEAALLPMVLGDLFHLPRNNPNWLLVEIMHLFDREMLLIYGNHDVHENAITPDDSFSVIAAAGKGIFLDNETLVSTDVNNCSVIIGGTPWGRPLPGQITEALPDGLHPGLSLWLAHHDIKVPGYEEKGWLRPRSISGVDLVINGHIHRCLEPVRKGATTWLTPGNIARRARSDATRDHTPSVLQIDVDGRGWEYDFIAVPHRPYDEVFYEAVADGADDDEQSSGFVAGLAEMQARRTQTGVGLKAFLDKNLDHFEPDVAEEIRKLSREVISDE
ncbi:MAG: metallophosphoesterase [Thermodesulfobacteriota bacterium]